jgi:hypothetical protein
MPLSLFARCRRFWRWLTGADAPLSLYRELLAFFGDELDHLETHEKEFPGYDIASLVRALLSFRDEGRFFKEVGSCRAWTMRQLLEGFNQFGGKSVRPNSPEYQRVAVDVEEEESVVSKGLYLLEIGPEAGAGRKRKSAAIPPGADATGLARTVGPPAPEKIAALLNLGQGPDYWDGMETNRVPVQPLRVSVACRSREAADRFFAELDDRRKRKSVYRGKVVSPALISGAIVALGFRAIKRVGEEDLVLPDAVRALIDRAIVGFYRHKDALAGLGIELKRGILLHGPPGTGKTSISLYLAGLLPDFTVCFVCGDQLLAPRAVCQMARYLQPAMVVFEDIDLIAVERNSNGLATVLGELMNQIDGCEPTDQVLFVMNTNSLARLESAVRNRPGRVDQIIEIPLPDRAARRQLLATFARGVPLANDHLDRAVDALRDMSPAMIKEVVKRSVVAAIQRGAAPAVEEADLLAAIEQVQALREPITEPRPGSFGFRASDGDGITPHADPVIPPVPATTAG